MKSPRTPFNRIWVDEVASSPLIMSHQIVPKPIFLITSIKKAHDTESNTLGNIKLEKDAGLFLLVKESSYLLYEHEVVLNKLLLDESRVI
jgi:hypothetical protein